MAIQQNFPAIAPSLNLSFALTKALDPRITFTRASTATYYGTETAKAEENLLLYSQEFNDSYWLKARISVTANDTTAPDGTTTAERLTQASGQTTAGVVFNLALPAIGGLAYTYSVFAKAGTGRNFVVLEDTFVAASQNTWFDLSTGTVGTVNPSHTASIVNVGNGWYRCIITVTAFSTATRGVLFRVAETDNSLVVTDDQGFIFLWGAQLEQRSAATAYTPTTTQPITNFIPVLESAASGVARFDHNPTTFESLGLLIEEQRTNSVLRSEEFDNASWTKQGGSITANTIVAPNGTLTGDKLVTNNGVTGSQAIRIISYTSGVAYTLSIYAKAVEGMNVIALTVEARAAVEFNLSTNATTVTAQLVGWTVTNPQIVDVGNGWKRVSAVFTAGDTVSANTRMVEIRTSIGNGFNGVYFWGAQLEAGAFPTSYIPTVASQVTRAADAASMTGANFSSWYRQDEGTVYCEFATTTPTTARAYQIGDGTVANRMDGLMAFNTFSVFVSTNNSVQVNMSTPNTLAANTFGRVGFAYKTDDFACFLNAGSGATDTSALVPVVNQIGIGRRLDTTAFLNGTIKRISYYPVRVTNEQLQGLTT